MERELFERKIHDGKIKHKFHHPKPPGVMQRAPLRTLELQNVNLSSHLTNKQSLVKETKSLVLIKSRNENNSFVNVARDKENISLTTKAVNKVNLIATDENSSDTEYFTPQKNWRVITVISGSAEHKRVKKSLSRPKNLAAQELCSALVFSLPDTKVCNTIINVPYAIENEDEPADNYTRDIIIHLLEIESHTILPVTMSGYLRASSPARIIRKIVEAGAADWRETSTLVQYACWYLDHYLSVAINVPEQLYIMSYACFWLACKIHGNRKLSSMIVKYAKRLGFLDDLKVLEANVLKKLNYPTHPVIPMDFLPYLSRWCDPINCDFLEEYATFVMLSGLILDKNINCQYPSVIAIASIIIALKYTRQTFQLRRLKLCPLFVAASTKINDLQYVCGHLSFCCGKIFHIEANHSKGLIELFSLPPHFIAPKIKDTLWSL